ncbi:MAG: hypothetical protein WCT99_13340, partial [Bacteroidota bacterium]
WDRPFQAQMTANLNVKKDDPLFDVTPLNFSDYNVYTRFFFQSGKRYTPQLYSGIGADGRPEYRTDYTNLSQGVGEYWFYVNLNIEKYYDLGFAKMTLSLEIQNLFDNKNAQIVNPITGHAYEYGANTPLSYNDPKYPDLQGTISPFPYNPARYLAPRNAKVGVSFRF